MTKYNLSVSDIKIHNFIFHIVHNGQDSATLLEKTPIGEYSNFFKQRIIEIYDGNKFLFTEDSTFLANILEIESQPRKFVQVSKTLAAQLHTHQDNRIKPGVMILIKASIEDKNTYILIKYDNEDVITYKTRNGEAILEEISNTFSKNRDALQKSVIVHLDDTQYATVIDRSDRQNVTHFFKGFLGIKRNYSTSDLTEKVRVAYLDTVKTHRHVLPPSYTSRASEIYYDTVQNQGKFDHDTFLINIFGEHYKPEFENTFKRELKKRDILGESFVYDKKLKKPSKRKYKTQEGISIQVEAIADDTISIKENTNNTVITITTKKLVEEA